MPHQVGVLGSGPATDALTSTLAEYESVADDPGTVQVSVSRLDAPALEGVNLGITVGRVDDSSFAATNDAALDAGCPWIAVELGGIGGYPVVRAGITEFPAGGPCYACLETRVGANVDQSADPVGALEPATRRVAGAIAGEAAVELLAAESDPERARVTELPRDERELLAVPGCRCGGDRSFDVGRADGAVPLETALERAERGLDDRLGIVSRIGEAESFPAPYYLATVADTSGFSDARAPAQAAGVDGDWDAAFMKALGEAYERYAAGVYTAGDVKTAAAGDLDASVPPTDFVTPAPLDWDETTETRWVEGTDLATGHRTALPADLVFHPPAEEWIRPAVTTGLGLQASADGALRAGLYEVIERDAAMLAWYSTFEPLGLSIEDEGFETLRRRAASEGLAVEPLLLTQDVDVPVVAVAVHRDEWPRFALGSAAHLDPARAARGALAEAVQNWMELRGLGPDDAADASGAIGQYAGEPGPAGEFVGVETSVPATSVGPDEVPGGPDELDALIDAATDVFGPVYAARTTTRDLATMGFEAVRVLVPPAQPLFLGESYFGTRARTVPDSLGFEPALDRPHHPFP